MISELLPCMLSYICVRATVPMSSRTLSPVPVCSVSLAVSSCLDPVPQIFAGSCGKIADFSIAPHQYSTLTSLLADRRDSVRAGTNVPP